MRSILEKNKRAVSLMVGYVLLVTIAIVMGAVVYNWMKSYVPRESLECPDSVSVFIKDVVCEGSAGDYNLMLNLTNNGRFSVDGYFIRAAESSEQTIASKDISDSIVFGASAAGGVVRWNNQLSPGKNAFEAGYSLENPIYFIEITPIIYETIENKIRLVNCGSAKVKENVNCG